MRRVFDKAWLWFFCVLMYFTSSTFAAPDLGQNWNNKERSWFYVTTQGSRLIRQDWLLALERPDSKVLFLADCLARFGYISDTPDCLSGNRLPIGFAMDNAGSTKWIGMTCAACHTSNITFRRHKIRVDGAPSGADMFAFLAELGGAIEKAVNDNAAFSRFAAKVLNMHDTQANRARLHGELKDFASYFSRFIKDSTPTPRWGPARLDAFGMIFNRVTSIDLPPHDNSKPPNAPVSYPFLWGTSWHDKTQWNGAVPNDTPFNRFGRNIGQVLGVFGEIDFAHPNSLGFYKSSVARVNLINLETQVKKLKAPRWPDELFSAPRPEKVEHGRQLFESKCSRCHLLVAPGDQLKNVKVTLVPQEEVATDVAMTRAASTRTAHTHGLKNRRVNILFGDPLKSEELATVVLTHAVAGAMFGFPLKSFSKERLKDYKLFVGSPDAENYKARPLNGIWATAPFLHNGSVPSLWELLLPPNLRTKKFFVGSREFDPTHVGFISAAGSGSFEFDTNLDGNHNTGHSYGTELSDEERWALVEFMKKL